MPEGTVDRLSIEIGASSKRAANQIDKLTESLKRLKEVTSTGLGGELKKDLQGLGSAGSSGVKSLTSEMKKATEQAGKMKNAVKDATQAAAVNASKIEMPSVSGRVSGMIGAESAKEMNQASVAASGFFKGMSAEAIATLPKVRLVEAQVQSLKEKLSEGIRSGSMGDKEIASTAGQIQRLQAQLQNQAGGGMENSLNSLASASRRVMNTIGPLINRIGGGMLVPAFRRAGSAVAAFSRNLMTIPFRGAANGVSALVGKLRGVTSALGRIVFYRTVRTVIKEIGQAFRDGVNNLYQWSKAFGGEFSKSMDTAATSMQYLKNSLGAMVAPLVNALAPVLDMLVDKFVELINVVNQFFARLTGASTWTRAIKVPKEYADAATEAGEAAKKALRYIAPFDELNVLPSDSGTGSAGKKAAEDYSSMFETMQETLSGTGPLADIFEVFKRSWETHGKTALDEAKRMLGELKDLALDIGRTFLQVFVDGYGETWLNSIFDLMGNIFGLIGDVARAFREAWDENDRGYKLLASIFSMASAINNLWSSLIGTFREAWNENDRGREIIGKVLEIFTNINQTVTNLTDSFRAAWDVWGAEIWGDLLDILKDVLDAIDDITEATADWAKDLDFGPLLESVDSLLKGFRSLGKVILDYMGSAYKQVLLPLAKWTMEKGLPAVLETMGSAFRLLGTILEDIKPVLDWVWNNVLQPWARWSGDSFVAALKSVTAAMDSLNKLLSKDGGNKNLSDFMDTLMRFGDAQAKVTGFMVAFSPLGIAVKAVSTLLEAFGVQLDNVAPQFGLAGTAVKTFTNILTGLKPQFGSLREAARTGIEGMRTAFSGGINKISEVAGRIMDAVRRRFENAWDNLKRWWSNRTLSGFKIKLPHFKMSGSFSLNPPSLPTLSVSWYKKGGVVDGATLIGAGEAGKEAIVPLERNTEWINSVAEKMSRSLGDRDGTGAVILAAAEQIVTAIRENSGRSGGAVTLNVNGREFARATYNDQQAVAREKGVSLISNFA